MTEVDFDRRAAQLHVLDGRGRVMDIVELGPDTPVARRKKACAYVADEAARLEGSRVELVLIARGGTRRTLPADPRGVPARARKPRMCVEGQDLLGWLAREWEESV